MKSILGKCGMLVLLGVVGGLSAVACSSEDDGSSPRSTVRDGRGGEVRLKLVPIAGVTLNSVNYLVTGTPTLPGAVLPSGTLPTPGTSDTFSFGVPVPVGTGYTLSLSAASAEPGDDITCTGSFGTFDIAPNAAVDFSVTLTCIDNTNGQIVADVGVETDACPRLIADFAVAIPALTLQGESSAINALGHDLDAKVVSYEWSVSSSGAGVGSFTNPSLQATSFNCHSFGVVPLRVTMSNGECSKTLLTQVTCFHIDCPSGTLEPGEDCDPGIPPGEPGGSPPGTSFGCPADCSVACGDGVIEAPAEQCELPFGVATATCTAQCRIRFDGEVCGDGLITGFETCDGTLFLPGTPAGSTCSPSCQVLLAESPCGDGIVGGLEECDPNNTAQCSNDCELVASPACTDCEAVGACAEFALSCLDSPGTVTATEQGICYDVQECIADTNCGDGASSLLSCFCGSLTPEQCVAAPNAGTGSPAGPCASVIRSGMGPSATNVQVLERFLDQDFPAGAGILRFNCLKSSLECRSVCGFDDFIVSSRVRTRAN